MIGELKPYAEYQPSGSPWIDAVPAHWQVRPAFGAYSPIHERNTGMRERTVLSLSYGRIVVKPVEKLRGLVPESFETYQIVNPGDIVVRTTDLQNDHTSLRVGSVRDRGIITSAYLALRTAKDVMPEYGYQFLNVWDGTKAIYGYGSGLRQNLDFSHFKRMPVLVPPVDEQAAIVRFLNWANGRLERTIRAKHKVIALLNEQKQAIIDRAVTRGLDSSVPLRPSGIEWLAHVPHDWEVRPLKAVCAIQSGVTLGKDYAGQATHEYPYLRVANVQAGQASLAVVKTIRVPKAEAAKCQLQAGDVLMTEGGDPDKLGRGCVWEGQIEPCLHQNHVFAVRPDRTRLLPSYLSAVLGTRFARAYFESTAKQTTNLASTNKTKIGRFMVLLPAIEQQGLIMSALAGQLRPVEVAASRLQREIELLREYRIRLMTDVVTGQLDVREAAARLPDEAPSDALDAAADTGVEAEDVGEEEALP